MDCGTVLSQRRRRFRWCTIGLVVALTLFGLTDVRRRARIEPGYPEAHRTDLTIFTGAGAAFLSDDAPYSFANPRGWKYAYPPLLALWLSPLSALHPQWQAVIWFAISCGISWLAWREAVRISRNLGRDIRLTPENKSADRRLGWVAVATIALPALNCLQRGQVGLLNLWLLMWGFRLLIEPVSWRGAVLAGLVLALPIVVKVTPALPVVIAVGVWGLAQWRQGRIAYGLSASWGLALGGLLFVLIVPSAILGWNANLRHLETWRATILTMAVEVDPTSTVETPYTVRNQNLNNAVYRCGNLVDYLLLGGPDDRTIDAVPFNPDHQLRMDAAWVSPALLGARLFVLALLAAAGLRASRSGDRPVLAAVFGLACVASLIVSPLSRGHYFVFLLPAVLWSTELHGHSTNRRLDQFLLWTPLLLAVLHYTLLDIAGRIGLLGIGVTLWFVVAAIVLLRRTSRMACAEPKSDVATLSRAA